MRVFKGGFISKESGQNYPSLRTCDMIKPETKIKIDDTQFEW